MSRRGLPPAAAGIPAPADKRFRRSDVRQGRRRTWRSFGKRAGWFGGGALVVLVVGALAAGALLDAPVLRVNDLVVRGNSRLATAEIEARLSGIRGESVLRVDLEQYRQRLGESPWVASAELWRVLPSTVHVRIVERIPIAVARLRGEMHLVDDAGVIIDAFGPAYQDYDLPIVDGFETVSPDGRVVEPVRVRLVQRLFAEVSARDDLFRRISQVNVSNPRNAVVLLEGEPAALHLGDREFLQRLQQYEDMAPMLRDRPPQQYYELRFGNAVWVK